LFRSPPPVDERGESEVSPPFLKTGAYLRHKPREGELAPTTGYQCGKKSVGRKLSLNVLHNVEIDRNKKFGAGSPFQIF